MRNQGQRTKGGEKLLFGKGLSSSYYKEHKKGTLNQVENVLDIRH
jgi:hypothetical protein